MNQENQRPSSLAALLMQLDCAGVTDHRRYQAVRTYLNFRAREKDIPLSGVFELTPLCNLDCKMCYVHLQKDQMHGVQLLSADTWKRLIDQAVAAGMMYAKLTGGECLTYPGFREIYLYLRELGIETEIYTNGVLLRNEMLELFRQHPPAGIQITLYGADEDGYLKVTGHRMFQTVLENITKLKQAGLPLSIAITPNRFMEDGEAIVKLVHSLQLPIRINSGLMAPREETGRQKQDACLDTYVNMLKLKNRLSGLQEVTECDEAELPVSGGGRQENPVGVTCGAGRSTFSISWQGLMRPCNTFPDIAADVLSGSFMDAWKQINAAVKAFPLPSECVGCKYQKACKHCVAEHASEAPIGHASPSICAWARRMTAEGLIRI